MYEYAKKKPEKKNVREEKKSWGGSKVGAVKQTGEGHQFSFRKDSGAWTESSCLGGDGIFRSSNPLQRKPLKIEKGDCFFGCADQKDNRDFEGSYLFLNKQGNRFSGKKEKEASGEKDSYLKNNSAKTLSGRFSKEEEKNPVIQRLVCIDEDGTTYKEQDEPKLLEKYKTITSEQKALCLKYLRDTRTFHFLNYTEFYQILESGEDMAKDWNTTELYGPLSPLVTKSSDYQISRSEDVFLSIGGGKSYKKRCRGQLVSIGSGSSYSDLLDYEFDERAIPITSRLQWL